MIVVAHAGHWITTVVYLVPVIGFMLWLGFVMIRDRLKERRNG